MLAMLKLSIDVLYMSFSIVSVTDIPVATDIVLVDAEFEKSDEDEPDRLVEALSAEATDVNSIIVTRSMFITRFFTLILLIL